MAKKKSVPKQDSKKDDEDLKAIYEWSRKRFSAADLQKFAVVEKTVPLRRVIAEMEEIHRKITKNKD